jgi:2-alkenal reductase
VTAIFAYQQNGNIALGTGFVVDSEGHIITNMHVVQNATQIEVDFPSGDKVYASLIGSDPDSDLAVLKVDVPSEKLDVLPLGDSSAVKIGDPVVAIGNPFGLYNSMTTGVVSGKGRMGSSLRPSGDTGYYALADLIQTDAAINPGNSGGPLLNLQGEVIGVNRSILTTSTDTNGNPINSGLGFAVSSNIVRRVLPSLIANGSYDYPYLGMGSLPEIHLQEQQALNLPYSYGVYVTDVVAGGPAEEAGLKAGNTVVPSLASAHIKAGGDLILAVNHQKVMDTSDLVSYLILNTSPNDQVVFTVWRAGTTLDLTVTLGSRP